MSKQIASRAWMCAFCFVAVIVFAIGLLFLSPARHRGGPVASSVSLAIGSPAARGRVQASYANLPLAFERNQGQTDAQVQYLARGNGYTLFLTENEAVFALHASSAETRLATKSGAEPQTKYAGEQNAQASSSATVRMQLAGANAPTKISAGSQLPGVSNYYLGNDPSRWRTDVPHYARVSYEGIYPGVNIAFHGAQRQVEFDFVVAPGANPAPIGFRFAGAQSLNTDDSGNLVIESAAGNVLLHKPVAYQEQNGARQLVDAQFVLKANNQISFELGNYDRSRELVIDPTVSYNYSTYLGGSGDDEGQGIAFDSAGAAYVTGQTASQDFPGTSGGFTGTARVFVTKFAADGSSLVYSTYVGGSGSDSGNAIAVDASGDAFVAGGTSSNDFPHTGGFQTTYGGGSFDGFVFELGSAGALTYSTFLGGSSSDFAFGIAVDATGEAYVVGQTFSSDFPTTPSPIQPNLIGTSSGFVTKLNNSGNALVYSTYLAGGTSDLANAVALDVSGDAYVTGKTSSTTFPVTANVFQKTCGSCSGGVTTAFVAVVNPGGTAYNYASYLGGSGGDSGTGIAVDSAGNAYVTGATQSADFPLQSAFQGTNKGNGDSFVSKINPTGSALVYSTYLGGSGDDLAANIAVDSGGNAYVTGQTSSNDFPLAGATQSSLKGASDAFVTEINSTGSALAFSTYLGGTGVEDSGAIIGSIAVDAPGGFIYVTGSTNSTDFPPNSAFQSTPGGGLDAFVAKYTQVTFNLAAATPTPVSAGTSGTSNVKLTSVNGYSSAVTLACSVTGTGSPAPACSASSFSPASPITPTSGGATTTLTITTTPPSAAMVIPGRIIPGRIFYATWLPIAGLSLAGIGFAGPRRRKFLGLLMLAMVMTALLVMPACGGSSSSTTCTQNCGVSGGTPPGAYTVTVTGTGTDGTVQTAQVTLTVNQ